MKGITPMALPLMTPEEFEQFAIYKDKNEERVDDDISAQSLIRALLGTLFGN